MICFLIIFLIVNILIFGLDRYFYITISKILDFVDIEPNTVLQSLGYYNKSIFTNKTHMLFLSFAVAIFIWLVFFIKENLSNKKDYNKIKKLENDLIKINNGDYSLDFAKEDKYSSLRDEIYKIIINLKSLEDESKRQKIVLKEDLSNIAHQLKTPITSIGFMAELIKEDMNNTHIYIDKLYSELEKLSSFTEILLKLSKVNSSTIEYKLKKVFIREIIEDIMEKLDPKSEIDIEYIGEDFPLMADETWIYEAFLNIIKNAIEHTKNKVCINLNPNPIYNTVTISDNGNGLDEKVLNRIFDRFYRGETSMPGYGIGLNLSKTIIEKHNGFINPYNENGLNFEIKFYNVI